MKHLIWIFALSSICHATICPSFTGLYSGDCKVAFLGTQQTKHLIINIEQVGCDKFIYNELGTNRYYTLNKSTIYYEGSEKKYLRSAATADNGNTLILRDTVVRKSEKYGDLLNIGNISFKKIDEESIAYESERFDLLKDELATSSSCPLLKKEKP